MTDVCLWLPHIFLLALASTLLLIKIPELIKIRCSARIRSGEQKAESLEDGAEAGLEV